jgi:lipoprotein-anchoring transpeptidase ErfK/SrfK
MDNQNNDAQDLIIQARDALRRGDKETAHRLGEQAALQNPGSEDAWLILTATDPNPEDALAYAQQALEIDPTSARALKAVEWAIARLHQTQTGTATTGEAPPAAVAAAAPPLEQKETEAAKPSNRQTLLYAAAFIGLLLCIAVVFAAYTGLTRYAFPSFVNKVSAVPTHENLWAPMKLVKPAMVVATGTPLILQPADPSTTPAIPTQEPATAAPLLQATAVPTDTLSLLPTEPPASTATGVSSGSVSATPQVAAQAPEQATEMPGAMSMQIVEDTPTSQYIPPTASSVQLPDVASSGGARWIDVDLTNQRVYAYEGDTMINSFIVSTGTWLHPTVTGQYRIYVKYRSAPMSGPGYYLPNVPYIMYFYKGYGLHGTYWHNNFGTPMSHGCVNLRTDEAAWLYNWSSVGTLVNVHY